MVRRITIVGVLCLALALVAAACGDSSDDTGTTTAGGGDAAPEALLEQAARDAAEFTNSPSDFEPFTPGPAPAPARDRKVGGITCIQAVPICTSIAKSMQEAMRTIGWTGNVVDGTADVSKQRSAAQTFVTQGYDGLMLAAIDPHGISDVLKRGVDKGMNVGMMAGIDPQPFGGIGPSVDVRGGLYRQGQELAAWVANDSGGEATILRFVSSDNPGLLDRLRGFEDYLERFPGIRYAEDTINVPFGDIGPALQAQAQSVFQKYPRGSVDYVFGPFDGFTTFLVNAAQALRRGDLKMVSFDGEPQIIDFIRDGKNLVATQATAWGWCSWLLVDQMNRAFNDEPYAETGCGSQIIDKSNMPPPGVQWDGNADYKTAFKRLWGVQ